MSEDKAQPGQDTSEWDKGYNGTKVDPRDNADYTVPAQTEAAPAQEGAIADDSAPTGAPDGAPDLSPEGDQDQAPDGTTAADVGEAANDPQPVGHGAEAAPTGDGGEA